MNFSNYRFNSLGGIDADLTLETGEVVGYTLSKEQIEAIPPSDMPTPLTEEQLKEKDFNKASLEVKALRDSLLSSTDYLVMPDYPTPPVGIIEYRQALRDITLQEGFPFEIEWPVLDMKDSEEEHV